MAPIIAEGRVHATRVTLVRSMPAHSSRNADSFGVIIVLAFLGGCVVARRWRGRRGVRRRRRPGSGAGLAVRARRRSVLLGIAGQPSWRPVSARVARRCPSRCCSRAPSPSPSVWLVSLVIAVGVVNLVGMAGGFLGLATVLAGWVRVSAGPVAGCCGRAPLQRDLPADATHVTMSARLWTARRSGASACGRSRRLAPARRHRPAVQKGSRPRRGGEPDRQRSGSCRRGG